MPLVAALVIALTPATQPPAAQPSAAQSPAAPAVGRLTERLACKSDPTQTYTLYLPSAYTAERTWPALLVFDPGGRGTLAAEVFREAAETYGWVVLSSNDTRNGAPAESNMRALQALWREVHQQYSTDPRRMHAAGFSAGGMLAWELGRRTGGLAGVIATGSRFAREQADQRFAFPSFGAAGDTDFNHREMRAVHERLRAWGTPERLEFFEGAHVWMPASLAREGLEWLEVQDMKKGLRPVDAAMLKHLLERDVAQAAALEAEGQVLEAERRYRAAAATFAGLLPVEDATKNAERLAALPATARARKDEARWQRHEEAQIPRMEAAIGAFLGAPDPMPLARLRNDVDLEHYLKRAQAPGYEGAVSRRILETLASTTGFFLTGDLLSRGEYARALPFLEIATEASPKQPGYWYTLARVLARTGARARALDALEKSMAAGFSDRARLAAEEDFASLRREARFQAIVSPTP
jgi:predicted esterase